MKVRELIQDLLEMNQNAEIYVELENTNETADIESVRDRGNIVELVCEKEV